QQHDSTRYSESPCRNRSHETGGRFGRLYSASLSLHRDLVWIGGRFAGLAAGRRRLDGAGSAGGALGVSVRKCLQFRGAENRYGTGRFGARGGGGLGRV